jgi:hypothetical protein
MLVFLLAGTVLVNAQGQTQAEKDNYTKVITARSAKVVTNIGITDSTSKKFIKVRNILVDHYRVTGGLFDDRNAAVKALKADPAIDKATVNAKVAGIDSTVDAKIAKHHAEFLASLGKELNAEQVTAVKDELTYKKVAVTYNAYVDELPQLTDAQKAQLKAWLVEAREKAIDAGSSDAKTAIFGKYKGRINNFLSAQGYDMKKAGEEWQKRLKERAASKGQ